MTQNEAKTIRPSIKVLVDAGLVSAGTMEQVLGLVNETGEAKPMAMNLITRKKAAEILGVSGQSLINWSKLGKIQPVKLAGRRSVRYRMEDIEGLCMHDATATAESLLSTKK